MASLGFGYEPKLHSIGGIFIVVLLVSNKGQIVTGPAKSVSNGKSTRSDIGLPRNTLLQLDPSEKLNI